MFRTRRKKRYLYSSSREPTRRERRYLDPPPRRKRRGGLLRLLGDFLSWFGFLLLVSGAVVGAGLYFLHARFDDAVRTHVEAKFRAAYPNHQVSLRAARRLEGQGIELRGLTVAEVGENGVPAPLVSIDELLVRCNASLEELLAGKLDAKELVLRRMKLHAAQDDLGEWNLSKLLPFPSFGSQQLPIVIEESTAEVVLAAAAGGTSIAADVKKLELIPIVGPEGNGPARVWQFRGTLAGPHLQYLTVDGSYDLTSQLWEAAGEVRALKISPELVALAPPNVRSETPWLNGLKGAVNARYAITNSGAVGLPFRIKSAEGDVVGEFADSRLPFPLSDLKAHFKSDGQALVVRDASARLGQAILKLSCSIDGFREDAPCTLQLSARQLQVDGQLVDTMPAEWRELWGMLTPEGVIDAEVNLAFDGHRVQQTTVIDCQNVSFAYHKFPYRLTHGQGRVEWRDDLLTFEGFRAYAVGREVLLNGKVRNPGPEFSGHVTVEATSPVPIDEKLVGAIPEPARQFVERLNTHGFVTLSGRFEKHGASPLALRRELTIGIKDGAVDYEQFPYPLSKINGRISMVDGHWKICEGGLTGVKGSAWVQCDGGWGPDDRGVMQVDLAFNAQDVPLDDELLKALNPEVKTVWQSIRPRGTVDRLEWRLLYDGGRRKTTVDLTATKNTSAGNTRERSITIEPVWLPYQMDDVEGVLHWHDGLAELKNIRGRHSDTEAQVNGVVERTPDGRWKATIDSLNVDRVRVSKELAAALPQRLSNAVTRLNISGPFDMTGRLVLTGRSGDTVPTSTEWDLEFDIEDGGMDCGVRLEHLHGGLRLIGGLDQRGLVSRGSLLFDSLIYKGIQFTQLRGPISIDDERLGFGEWSTRLPEEGPHQPIQGRVFGGTVLGSGEVKLSGDFPFSVEGRLMDGDLATISRETTSRRHDISGRTHADIKLQGNSLGTHTFVGSGNFQLRQADIYELPVMARLLKVLTISPPNATAFTSSDAAYRIEGDRIYLDPVTFNGDLVSLAGKGEMTLDGAIDMEFYTTVGRADIRDIILRPLLKEAGKRLIAIHVTGTVAEPVTSNQFVPELNDTLQNLFPGQPLSGDRTNMTRLPKPLDVRDRLTPK